MTEIPAGFDDVADALLQFLRTGKAAVTLALPDQVTIDPNFKIAAGTGNERHFAEAVGEGL